jgi:polysaccharide export outer membrane protein
MKLKFLLSVSILLFLSSYINPYYSQTEQQVKKKLQQEGIYSREDILKELQKRNMTEDEARIMAAQYGMDYDTFISTHIMGDKQLKIETTQDTVETVESRPQTELLEEPVYLKEIAPEKPVVPLPTEGGLEFFGYKLFQDIPRSFEPTLIGPVDPGYLIGPGDVLRLSVWGAVELQYQLNVDQQGNVFIPTVGQVFVSGIPYEELQNKLTAYLSKFYEGLTTEPPSVFLDVSLAKLKPIKIFVMGEVSQPGGYNISSFATVFNALYAVGGPLVSGSLREIRVIRNNKVITTVDLYDYLLEGKLIGDVRLQNNDMIFIPPRKKSVSIKGEVLRPAIYELKENENLEKLLHFSGGLKTTAYIGRAQVERIIPFDQREKYSVEKEILDIDLTSFIRKMVSDISLYDKDIITVFPIIDKIENSVTIQGAVRRPGNYDLNKAATITDLIEEADGLLPETYYGKADIFRTMPDQSHKFISIDLAKAVDGDPVNNIRLEGRDVVKIYSVYELVDKQSVSISGYVKNPFSLPYADNLTLYDMVFRAGGLQDPVFRGRAFVLRGDLIRVNPDGLTTRIIPFDLEKLLYEKTFNMDLKPGDNIYIYNANVEKILDKFITVGGQVRSPGRFQLNTNMTVMDAILQAGGFTEDALRTEVYVSRVRPGGYPGDQIAETHIVQLPLSFEKKLLGGDTKTESDFYLQHKDVVVVRRNPLYEDQRNVSIDGEVMYPGSYILESKNQTLKDLLDMSGGTTSEAFLFGTEFIRNGPKLNIDFEKLVYGNSEKHNVLLKDGDKIFIPKRPNTVLVKGEVNNPGLFKFVQGESVKDYIDKAGGVTDSANYILHNKANGETEKVGFGFFSGDPDVHDGSVIIVTKLPPPPPDEAPFDISGTIKDVLAIIVSAVTIIVLVNNL